MNDVLTRYYPRYRTPWRNRLVIRLRRTMLARLMRGVDVLPGVSGVNRQ